MRNKIPAFLAVCALCVPLPRCSAQEQKQSTAAPVQVQNPLMLNISKDFRSSRVSLDYSIRWDFSDLASFRPGLGALYEGARAVSTWDITENTRLNYYGFRTNPWQVIMVKEKKGGPYGEAGVNPGPAAYSKRVRLSLSPLVEDLKLNFDEDLRGMLLKSSQRNPSPARGRIGDERAADGEGNGKYFVKDVLWLDVWGLPVPYVEQTGRAWNISASSVPERGGTGGFKRSP